MTQPDIPARDADSSPDVDAASAPSYPQRSTGAWTRRGPTSPISSS